MIINSYHITKGVNLKHKKQWYGNKDKAKRRKDEIFSQNRTFKFYYNYN